MYNVEERASLGWKQAGEAWQKRFRIGEGAELTVIVGQEEGSVDGLAFKETLQDGSVEDRCGTRLEDWMDRLTPEALIDIIAKRDISLSDESDGT
jgi:hypothetical protein